MPQREARTPAQDEVNKSRWDTIDRRNLRRRLDRKGCTERCGPSQRLLHIACMKVTGSHVKWGSAKLANLSCARNYCCYG